MCSLRYNLDVSSCTFWSSALHLFSRSNFEYKLSGLRWLQSRSEKWGPHLSVSTFSPQMINATLQTFQSFSKSNPLRFAEEMEADWWGGVGEAVPWVLRTAGPNSNGPAVKKQLIWRSQDSLSTSLQLSCWERWQEQNDSSGNKHTILYNQSLVHGLHLNLSGLQRSCIVIFDDHTLWLVNMAKLNCP